MSTTNIILAVVLAIAALVLGWAFIELYKSSRRAARRNAILNYRLQLLDAIGAALQADILAGRSWAWRFAVYDSVSHEELMSSRKPLDSFYPDPSFLHPEATCPHTTSEVY